MKTTTESYDSLMKERMRNKSHVKISLISGATTYLFEDDEIATLSRTNEVDPLTRRVPKEELSFSVYDFEGNYNPSNPSGKWNALDENADITVTFGLDTGSGVIWLDADNYVLSGRPTYASGIATFKASSKLTQLTKTYYKGVYGQHSLYQLAVGVLTDAGLSASDYEIDSSLQEMITDAPIPITTHLNALQLIAHASCSTLRTKSGKIYIEQFNPNNVETKLVMNLDSIALNGDVISKIDTLYKVESSLYSYVPDFESSVLYDSVITSDGTSQCHIEYATSTDQVIEIEGNAEITNANYYANAMDFTITGEGSFHVIVTGKKIASSITKSQTIVSLNANGSTDTEKNQLITNYELQSALIYHVANYLTYRLTHSVKYRGNPEIESLDGIFFATNFDSYIQALVLKETITYNGAISGTLTLKSLSEINDSFLYDSDGKKVQDVNDEFISLISLTDYQSEYTTEDIDEFITEVIDNG